MLYWNTLILNDYYHHHRGVVRTRRRPFDVTDQALWTLDISVIAAVAARIEHKFNANVVPTFERSMVVASADAIIKSYMSGTSIIVTVCRLADKTSGSNNIRCIEIIQSRTLDRMRRLTECAQTKLEFRK